MEDEEFDPNITSEVLPLTEVLQLMLENEIEDVLGYDIEALLGLSADKDDAQEYLRLCRESRNPALMSAAQ